MCCPFSAQLGRMAIPGNRLGYLFSTVSTNNLISTELGWPNTELVKLIRDRFRQCGVGAGHVQLYKDSP